MTQRPDLLRAELDCLTCDATTDHELAYAGRLLVTSRCTRCGSTISRDVRRPYARDLGARMLSKPGRMARRIRRHPLGFVASLPRTTAAKPLRVLDEIRLVLGAASRSRRDP